MRGILNNKKNINACCHGATFVLDMDLYWGAGGCLLAGATVLSSSSSSFSYSSGGGGGTGDGGFGNSGGGVAGGVGALGLLVASPALLLRALLVRLFGRAGPPVAVRY